MLDNLILPKLSRELQRSGAELQAAFIKGGTRVGFLFIFLFWVFVADTGIGSFLWALQKLYGFTMPESYHRLHFWYTFAFVALSVILSDHTHIKHFLETVEGKTDSSSQEPDTEPPLPGLEE